MHPEEIKAAMRMKGISPAMLADELELSPSTVSQVISGRSVSARVQAAIAHITGIPASRLWAPSEPSGLRRVKAAAARSVA